mmetsp:Transcript_52091/g.131654  ORF Transcript_52091/g.131654 Transcript_52091/m.131654 type:complete len:238 (-) Transcript_52091:587-1300(-)
MRTVHLIIHRVAVFVGKVGSMNIINIAVAVIVHSVARDLHWVDPHLLTQVLMVVVDACVNNSHGNALANFTRPNLPRLWSIDVKAMVAVHPPKLREGWIVRESLTWYSLRLHAESLPQRGIRSVCGDSFQVLGSKVFTERALKINRAVPILDHLELLVMCHNCAVSTNHALCICCKVLAVQAPEGNSAVLVKSDLKYFRVLGCTCDLADCTVGACGDIRAAVCLKRNEVIARRGAAT